MKRLYYILFVSILIVSCAQQSGLSGGDKDLAPPEVDLENNYPKNGATNFRANDIVISFNEFIRLTNPNQNVIITPSLNLKPIYELKGKKVSIHFQEDLDINTTYTINFGNSISDITERNKLLNYSYVFSTGPVLDSLMLEGSIYDAFSKTSKEDILVGLYQSFEDSVGLTGVPYYFTKTNENGSFKFNNLKEGHYTLLAIADGNNNLKYDRYTESISFLDSSLLVTNDTLSTKYKLSVFREEQPENWILSKRYKDPGEVKVILNKKADVIKFKLLNNSFTDGGIEHDFMNTDSIHFWINDIDSISNIELAYQLDEELLDTVKIKVKKSLSKDSVLRFKTNTVDNLAYFSPVTLTFKTPIKEVSSKNIYLFDEDSISVPFQVTFEEKEVFITAEFKEDVNYELYLNPSAVIDHYNKASDSALLFFNIIPMNKYGNIVLRYEREMTEYQQIIQLVKEGVVLEEFIVKGKTEVLEFKNLLPGDYKLKTIDDFNNNGRWDTGDYLLKKQPELVKLFDDKINLKAGWDLDLTWKN